MVWIGTTFLQTFHRFHHRAVLQTFGMVFEPVMATTRFFCKQAIQWMMVQSLEEFIQHTMASRILLSQKPDYNAFIPTNSDGTAGYLYTAWEDRPAGISQVELEWNPSSNQWDVLSKQMLNLSDINGGWVLCFGSVSPWGTPLFSEELYFDDTEDWNNDGYRYHSDQLRLEQYLGHYPNPYDYGYIIEMEQATSTTPELVRHLTMGRFSHENALVMPDNKTVYLTDDGYDTVFFKFEADVAGDLSEGTLYAAMVTQDSTYNSASTGFDVEWLELGSSSNEEIQGWIDDYDDITTADYVQGRKLLHYR